MVGYAKELHNFATHHSTSKETPACLLCIYLNISSADLGHQVQSNVIDYHDLLKMDFDFHPSCSTCMQVPLLMALPSMSAFEGHVAVNSDGPTSFLKEDGI